MMCQEVKRKNIDFYFFMWYRGNMKFDARPILKGLLRNLLTSFKKYDIDFDEILKELRKES
jgi:hypothetical protein